MGAQVVITGRNEARLLATLDQLSGEGHQAIVADLNDESDRNALVAHLPMLQGVVHSAGVGDRTLSKMATPADLDRVMTTNFDAPVLLQSELLRKKKIEAQASIVFIASRAPFAPTKGNGLYSASKGALIAYAKVLGLELSQRLIRVNCICPAMVWTELTQRDAELTGADYTEVEKSYPLKRYGRPEDIAQLAVYLLGDCSQWMTGSCIDITGGGEFTLKA